MVDNEVKFSGLFFLPFWKRKWIMDRIENNGTEDENSYYRFLEALMRFPSNRMADEPLAKTIADGLEIFRLFPEAQTVN